VVGKSISVLTLIKQFHLDTVNRKYSIASQRENHFYNRTRMLSSPNHILTLFGGLRGGGLLVHPFQGLLGPRVPFTRYRAQHSLTWKSQCTIGWQAKVRSGTEVQTDQWTHTGPSFQWVTSKAFTKVRQRWIQMLKFGHTLTYILNI
jgi:hypothetical protein